MIKNEIDEIVIELENTFKKEPRLENTIRFELANLVRKIYSESIDKQLGWCTTFKVPDVGVLNLLNKINIDQTKLQDAFIKTWNIPVNMKIYMYKNVYYHTLLLFIIYSLRNRNESIMKSSMVLLLCKIWNGRLQKHIPYCNPDVMRYVVANLNGKYWARKFDSPITMIMNHYAVTLIKKYGKDIKADSFKSKRLFDQSWGRIRQVFISNMSPNIRTGKSEGKSGLQPLYFDAVKNGLSISTPKVRDSLGGDDIEVSASDKYTTHNYEELIDNINNFIIMNRPKYDQFFINFVNKVSTARPMQITLILNNMHSIKYTDYIHDILELMFKQINVVDKAQVCNQKFLTDIIQKKIISSKHSKTINQLKNVADLLLEQIFKDKIAYRSYSEYSNPNRGKLRKILFFGFGYNIQRFICSNYS